MTGLQGALIDGFNSVKKKAEEEALKKIKDGKAVMKNGVLVYLESIQT